MAQEKLDLNAYSDCELFPEKDSFDQQERFEEIKKLGGKSVTVYFVKGKSNKIKKKYTGNIDLSLIEKSDLPMSNHVSVLTVIEDLGDGQRRANFPLTDDKNFRIYLTECLNE